MRGFGLQNERRLEGAKCRTITMSHLLRSRGSATTNRDADETTSARSCDSPGTRYLHRPIEQRTGTWAFFRRADTSAGTNIWGAYSTSDGRSPLSILHPDSLASPPQQRLKLWVHSGWLSADLQTSVAHPVRPHTPPKVLFEGLPTRQWRMRDVAARPSLGYPLRVVILELGPAGPRSTRRLSPNGIIFAVRILAATCPAVAPSRSSGEYTLRSERHGDTQDDVL